MPNPIEKLSPERRMFLAAGLCLLVSFVFAHFFAPPPPPTAPEPAGQATLLHEGKSEMVSGSPQAATAEASAARVESSSGVVSATPAVPPSPPATDLGPLVQSDPPAAREVVIDTERVRFVVSTQGACLLSARLKDYPELDPPIELLEAQVQEARTVEAQQFWQARAEEARVRAQDLKGYKPKKGQPVPEEAWVELVPPYGDSAGHPLRLTFEKGASDEDLVYQASSDGLVVPNGQSGQVVFTAKTDSGTVLTKTLSFGGDKPGFEVTVGTQAPGGMEDLKKTLGGLWALEWPDGLGHLPFQFHGAQEANQLYSLRNDSKENSPTFRAWLLKQAEKVFSSGETRSFLEDTDRKVLVGAVGHGFDRLDGSLNYRHALEGRVGWINLETRYFIATFLPPQDNPMQGLYIAAGVQDRPDFDTRVGMGVISPLSDTPRTVRVYVGPKLTSVLSELGLGLERVVYDTWFGSVCLLVEWLLGVFYLLFPSYGLAIILLCVFSKVVLYPLSYKQVQMQKKMTELQPKVAELKERYKDDQQKQSQEMMKLWKKHGVNPMGGCFPMLAQIPIFIALYRTIQSSIDLRGASFLWIHDLSLPDMSYFLPVSLPFLGNALNILPFVMMAISMVQMQAQKKLMPDPSQAQMMMFMSIFFFFILYHFSSGLVIYWTANSLTQWLQQKAMEKLGHAAPRGPVPVGGPPENDYGEDSENEDSSAPPRRTGPPRKLKRRRKTAK